MCGVDPQDHVINFESTVINIQANQAWMIVVRSRQSDFLWAPTCTMLSEIVSSISASACFSFRWCVLHTLTSFVNVEYLCADWGPMRLQAKRQANSATPSNEIYFLKQIGCFTHKNRLVPDISVERRRTLATDHYLPLQDEARGSEKWQFESCGASGVPD